MNLKREIHKNAKQSSYLKGLNNSSPTSNKGGLNYSTNSAGQLPFTLPVKKTNAFNVGFKANPEDNTSRKQKVNEVLNEFKKQIQALQDKDGTSSGIKDKIKENSIGLYNTLDTIFSLHNLNIQLIYQDQSDSAVYIEPISHLGKAIHCLASIAVVLSKFPYSFLKIIELTPRGWNISTLIYSKFQFLDLNKEVIFGKKSE